MKLFSDNNWLSFVIFIIVVFLLILLLIFLIFFVFLNNYNIKPIPLIPDSERKIFIDLLLSY